MLNLFKKLLVSRHINIEKGKMDLLGHSIVFIPVEMFAYVIKESKNSKEIGNLIYEGCRKAAKDFSKDINKKYRFKNKREFSKWLIDLFSLSGWGILTLQKLDLKNKKAIFRLHDSPVCKIYGKSKEPLDHAIRGLLAGGSCEILNGNIHGVETKCASMNGSYCEFVMS